jgi:hypothetical protein
MSNDNILPFPNQLRDAVDDEAWQKLQGEFYLDCYFAQHGKPAENPDELREWLTEAQLFADTDNPFFRGWLVRRLSEPVD